MCDQPISMDTLYTIPGYGRTGGSGVDDGKILRGSRWNWYKMYLIDHTPIMCTITMKKSSPTCRIGHELKSI